MFHDQMDSLEEKQIKQEKSFQQSLKKEMQSSRKKVLAQNVRHFVVFALLPVMSLWSFLVIEKAEIGAYR